MSVPIEVKDHIQPPIDPTGLLSTYVEQTFGEGFSSAAPKFHHPTQTWWSLVQYEAQGNDKRLGVGRVEFDAQTGAVEQLTDDAIRTVHEKASILDAKATGLLPVDSTGYILREYARQKAKEYLWHELGMYYEATRPILREGKTTIWEFVIRFQMIGCAPIELGNLAVNATDGSPLPLEIETLNHIRETVHAALGSPTPASAAG